MENVIDLKRRIGRRLQTLRKQHHLSQEVVAKVLGVRSVTYCGYEEGKQLIRTRHCVKLARFYGVSLDYLLTLSNHR